jgi:hypothetical protein
MAAVRRIAERLDDQDWSHALPVTATVMTAATGSGGHV